MLAALIGAPLLPLARSGRVFAGAPVLPNLGVVCGEVDGVELQLAVHRPSTTAEPRPAVILLPSGAMMFGSRVVLREHAMVMAGARYVALLTGGW